MTTTDRSLSDAINRLPRALKDAGFRGEVERDSALRAAMSTDNSVYRILPDLIVAPRDARDVVTCMSVLERPEFATVPVTARGGGTGTNGQSLNRGIILDMRRHMHRLLEVDPDGEWADVEPGIVLDDLNAQLRPKGVFFAPETSTSTRCVVGGMVSTDASGKGSRIYGKTSDNLLGVEIARGQGRISSLSDAPDWAAPMLKAAETAARAGRAAFVANTPRLNRRFTGYDLERACPEEGGFPWWRLFPGSEGTLGPITRIRVMLRPLPKEKRLVVAGFASFRNALAAAMPLLQDNPTAIEVMDERVQALAEEAGLLGRLPEAYAALQGVKAAFDPSGRFNPGKLVAAGPPVMGIATTPFRPFNAPEGDPLEKAFACNGNAQCLSYAASVPMCPSFKATADVRHSPKGRADALRAWHQDRRTGVTTVDEADLIGTLDTCLGCKACASTCPVQVDISAMRAAFYADVYARKTRPLIDRAMLLAERLSPLMLRAVPLMRPLWPLARGASEAVLGVADLPDEMARPLPRSARIAVSKLGHRPLPEGTVLVWMDWFSALFDGATQRDVYQGLRALGYAPLFVEMLPAGKVAGDLGDPAGFASMAARLVAALKAGAASGAPMIGLDPAFVMALRQDYRKAGLDMPEVILPQEFLAAEFRRGVTLPQIPSGRLSLFTHCTESTWAPTARKDWEHVFAALGLQIDTPATGCCGMAGMFGHKKRHQQMSRKLLDLSWAGPLAQAQEAVATGFSCRFQTERLAGEPMRHPLGLIADRLGQVGAGS